MVTTIVLGRIGDFFFLALDRQTPARLLGARWNRGGMLILRLLYAHYI
jgi:hypothetical protein